MATDETTRKWATAAGDVAARVTAEALDRLEDGALRVLEQAAAADVGADSLRAVEQRLKAARAAGARLPREAGRVIAGATYFAARWTPAAVSSARETLAETSEFLASTRGGEER